MVAIQTGSSRPEQRCVINFFVNKKCKSHEIFKKMFTNSLNMGLPL